MVLFTHRGPSLRWGGARNDSACVYLEWRRPLRMKWLKNPFVLVIEGFVLGVILLATSSPNLVEAQSAHPPKPLDSSVIPNPSR